jgi:hypothetical protein
MEFTQKDTLRLTDFTEQAISDVAKDAETQIYLEKVTAIIRGAEAV